MSLETILHFKRLPVDFFHAIDCSTKPPGGQPTCLFLPRISHFSGSQQGISCTGNISVAFKMKPMPSRLLPVFLWKRRLGKMMGILISLADMKCYVVYSVNITVA